MQFYGAAGSCAFAGWDVGKMWIEKFMQRSAMWKIRNKVFQTIRPPGS